MESRSMDSRSLDSNVSLFEDTLKFYFVEIGDEPSTEIRFAREVSAFDDDSTHATIFYCSFASTHFAETEWKRGRAQYRRYKWPRMWPLSPEPHAERHFCVERIHWRRFRTIVPNGGFVSTWNGAVKSITIFNFDFCFSISSTEWWDRDVL